MKVFIAHPSTIDFRKEIYGPIRSSALNAEHEFFLPQENEIETITKELIKGCDALVLDVSAPSTGGGIEFGWADAFGKKLIVMHKTGTRYPGSVANVMPATFQYDDAEDMVAKLRNALSNQ